MNLLVPGYLDGNLIDNLRQLDTEQGQIVYQARYHTHSDNQVEIFLKRDQDTSFTSTAAEILAHEAGILYPDCPILVPCLGYTTLSGKAGHWLVYPFYPQTITLEGTALERFPLALQLSIINTLFQGLWVAFQRHGFIHNDLHGGNVLILPDHSVKVIDYDYVRIVINGIVHDSPIFTEDYVEVGTGSDAADRHFFNKILMLLGNLMGANLPMARTILEVIGIPLPATGPVYLEDMDLISDSVLGQNPYPGRTFIQRWTQYYNFTITSVPIVLTSVLSPSPLALHLTPAAQALVNDLKSDNIEQWLNTYRSRGGTFGLGLLSSMTSEQGEFLPHLELKLIYPTPRGLSAVLPGHGGVNLAASQGGLIFTVTGPHQSSLLSGLLYGLYTWADAYPSPYVLTYRGIPLSYADIGTKVANGQEVVTQNSKYRIRMAVPLTVNGISGEYLEFNHPTFLQGLLSIRMALGITVATPGYRILEVVDNGVWVTAEHS